MYRHLFLNFGQCYLSILILIVTIIVPHFIALALVPERTCLIDFIGLLARPFCLTMSMKRMQSLRLELVIDGQNSCQDAAFISPC